MRGTACAVDNRRVPCRPIEVTPATTTWSRAATTSAIIYDDDDRAFFCVTVDRIAKKYGWSGHRILPDAQPLPPRSSQLGDKGLSQRDVRAQRRRMHDAYNGRHGRINHLFGQTLLERKLASDGRICSNAVQVRRAKPGARRRQDAARVRTGASYAATVGVAFAPTFLATDELLQLFGRPRSRDRGVPTSSVRDPCHGRVRWQPP